MLISNCPTVTMIAVVIVKAVAPETKTASGLIFVARVISSIASLSVSSATNMAERIVRKAAATSISHIGLNDEPVFAYCDLSVGHVAKFLFRVINLKLAV